MLGCVQERGRENDRCGDWGMCRIGAEEMTVAESGKEEVLMDGEKERSEESKEGESDELKEKDTNGRARGEESESSEEQKDQELGEMRRK